MTIFAIILGGILSLFLAGFIVNKLFFSHERADILPYGKLVKVNGKNMHVYSLGEGDTTIVLLPGFGVPLMRELSRGYKVVCIEYFGVGFSDETKIPRTNENYTQEIRAALSLAGFLPPYVFMPHSGSGIYSEYYAAKYPGEVSAIIMLDTTSSATKGTKVPRFVFGLAKIQQAVGLTRITSAQVVQALLKKENWYTEKETHDYRKFMNHSYNDTFIDQDVRLYDNILEVMAMDFPDEIPVLKIVPTQTLKQVGEEYQKKHLNRLGANAKSVTLKGSHFIYHTNVREICDITTSFLLGEGLRGTGSSG